jgi:predicted N-formylglutamate amidohydrolase
MPIHNILIIADHASNAIPPELEPWGMAMADMQRHIAWDIGTADLALALAAQLNCPAIIAPWSRLVIDLNRDPDHPDLIPSISDGTVVPQNHMISDDERTRRRRAYFHPYHDFIAEEIAANPPALILSLHSFTPVMQGVARPWQMGLLYNGDDRAAKNAIHWFGAHTDFTVGDNEPYSGRALNYTMNRHGESHGIPYLSLEIRQDCLATPEAIASWAALIAAHISSLK